MSQDDRPIVLITGAAGNIGRSLAAALADAYSVVGFDQEGRKADFPLIGVDFTDDLSVKQAMERFRAEYGPCIASVIHLVAFFDFSGGDDPRYELVLVVGSRRTLRADR